MSVLTSKKSSSTEDFPYKRRVWIPSFIALQVAGLVVFHALQLVFQFQATFGMSEEAIASVVIYNSILATAIFLGATRGYGKSSVRPSWSATAPTALTSTNLLQLIQIVAWVGVFLRTIDRFILRRDLIGANIDLVDTSSTSVGAISSLLYPIGIVLVPVMLATGIKRSFGFWVSAWFLFAFPALDVFLVGKRGVAITLLGMLILLLVVLGKSANRKLLVGAAVGFAAFAVIGTAIFLRRISSYGFSLCHSLYNSGYSFTLRPSELTAQACSSGNPLAIVWQSVNNFGMYYVHGLYEYAYGRAYTLSASEFGWGRSTFGTLFKPFCGRSSHGACDYVPQVYREGVYTTFWGPWVQDFGSFTPVSVFVLGLLLALIQTKARRNLGWFPLYLYSGAVVLFMPVVNLIQSALGVYVLTACVLFIFLYNYTDRKQRANSIRRSAR